MVAARLVVGDEDALGEQVRAWLGTGLDGITFNLPPMATTPITSPGWARSSAGRWPEPMAEVRQATAEEMGTIGAGPPVPSTTTR